MKYLNFVGFGLLVAFIAIFIISAEDKNFYAFGVAEICAFVGIFCLVKANNNPKTS